MDVAVGCPCVVDRYSGNKDKIYGNVSSDGTNCEETTAAILDKNNCPIENYNIGF